MTLQGKIIEYIDQSKFICGLVMQDSGKRLRIITQKGREMNLPLARVVHQTGQTFATEQSREDMQRLLLATSETRQLLTEPVQLAEIWELAFEEGGAFQPSFLTELAFGTESTDDHVAAFLRCVFRNRIYFKYKEGKILVHTAEVVQQLQDREEKEKAREELLEQSAKALKMLSQGEVPDDWPDQEKCFALLQDYYLQGNDAPESALARDLLKKARLIRPHDPYHLLIKAGIWQENENVFLLKHDLPVEFPEEITAQATVHEPVADELLSEGRKDFRDLPLLTIDGEKTRDFDDALHIEKRDRGFLVGIHIADVTPWVTPGSGLFQEAMERGTSLYFPEGQIPMLPRSLSEDVCSLIKDKPRAALSFMVLLSTDGEVLEFELQRSVVQVKRQLTYTHVDQIFEDDPELKTLAALSRKLQLRRLENGALMLPFPDVNISVNGKEIDIQLSDVDTTARTLVAEFMILANTLGALYLCDREIPGLYRCQPKPRRRLFSGFEKDLFLNFRQRRNLSRGALVTKPKLHSGVGVAQYTTVTSPIRRLLDLVIQHQLVHILQGKGMLFSLAECKDFSNQISSVLSRANQVRQLRHRYWLLKYLEQKVGERMTVLVLDIQPRRVQVVIKDVLLESDLPVNQGAGVEPGDVISVTLAKANALDSTLRLEW